MKAKLWRRIVALVIDLIFISLLSSLVISLPIFNNQSDDLSKTFINLTNDYLQGKVTREEYNNRNLELSYQLERKTYVASIINIVIILAYFSCFDYFLEGQTIGKKLLKIKLKSYNGKKNNIFQFILREFIASFIYVEFINLILVFTLKKSTYISSYNLISNLCLLLYAACFIVVLFREDGRGIHDFLANTMVIDAKEIEEETKVRGKKNERI